MLALGYTFSLFFIQNFKIIGKNEEGFQQMLVVPPARRPILGVHGLLTQGGGSIVFMSGVLFVFRRAQVGLRFCMLYKVPEHLRLSLEQDPSSGTWLCVLIKGPKV